MSFDYRTQEMRGQTRSFGRFPTIDAGKGVVVVVQLTQSQPEIEMPQAGTFASKRSLGEMYDECKSVGRCT